MLKLTKVLYLFAGISFEYLLIVFEYFVGQFAVEYLIVIPEIFGDCGLLEGFSLQERHVVDRLIDGYTQILNVREPAPAALTLHFVTFTIIN